MASASSFEYDRFAPTKIKDEYIDEYNAPNDSTIEEEEYLESVPVNKKILQQFDNNRNNYEHHSYMIGVENSKRPTNKNSGKEDAIIYSEYHDDNDNDEPRLESPKQKVKDPYKNFKIIHNTSVNNSNVFASPQMNIRNESSNLMYQLDENLLKENANLPINSALKESTIQIAKINKMLEDHRKKKNTKIVEESLSSPVLGANFFQEMKDRLESRKYNGVSKLINLDDANELYTQATSDEGYGLRYDGPNVIESAETFGIRFPNNNSQSIDTYTQQSERYLNPLSARGDPKFNSDNKSSLVPSENKSSNSKPQSVQVPKHEKTDVNAVLMNRIEFEENQNLLREINKRMPNTTSNKRPNIPKDNSHKMKENININNGNLSMERKKPNLLEKPFKTTEKKINANKTNEKLDKSAEAKNKSLILNYKSRDSSSKESSMQIPNLFDHEKTKTATLERKKSPETKKTPIQQAHEEKKMLLKQIGSTASAHSTLRAPPKMEHRQPEPPKPVERKPLTSFPESKSMESVLLKKKPLPPQLDDYVPPHQEMNLQQRTPTNGSTMSKENSSPKHVYLKFGDQMMSTKSNKEEDSLSNCTYTEVLTKWFGKQPKHEPLKNQIAKLSKLNNQSQSNGTDTHLESPFGNSSTLTKEKRSFLEAQRLEFTPDSQVAGSAAKEDRILASQKRIQNFAGEPTKNIGYLKRDTTPQDTSQPKETSQSKTAKSRSPSRSIQAAPKETYHKKTQSMKDMKFTQASLMNSLKLRQEKLAEKKDLTREYRQDISNKSSFAKPKLDISTEDKPKWGDYNIYERNNMWATAKNSKIETLVSERQKRELDGCTFKPSTITSKIFYSTLKSNEIIPTLRKQSENEIPERYSPSKDPDNLMSERTTTTSRRRSISREKKSLQSYQDLYKFRKNWNDVSAEMPSYTKRHTINYATEGNNDLPKNFFSAPSRKAVDNMNETIKLQQMISQWKNHL